MTRRVLHAVAEFLPRSETFVYTLVTGQRRFEASVLCHTRLHAAEFPFPRIHIVSKPLTKRAPAWWISEAIARTTGRSPWRRGVEAVLARLKPDVVHAHFGTVGGELVAVTKAAGIPLVTSLYGVDAAVLPYLPRWRQAYNRLFRDGDVFLAEGPEMRKKIIAAGAPAERTIIQPISIDVAKYPSWTPSESPTVLFVGRFIEKKGLLDAIAAFVQARASVADARMVIVGGGPDEDDARALVARLNLDAVVRFDGMRPHVDVLHHLATATVLIHPSATAADGDSEGGAPTILLEAQAIGTPIVSTRHADIPHVVPPGPGVTLCDEHDVAALAAALVSALRLRERSGAAHVMAHHDVRANVERLEQLYESTLSA
jgi:colanic acid/amylovoran biosynthesis glycosyltransferase